MRNTSYINKNLYSTLKKKRNIFPLIKNSIIKFEAIHLALSTLDLYKEIENL